MKVKVQAEVEAVERYDSAEDKVTLDAHDTFSDSTVIVVYLPAGAVSCRDSVTITIETEDDK